MATITTRAGKGSPLTNNEVDANFTNLNTDKAETDGATLTNVDINSGAIDGVTIGGASAGAGTFTNLTADGILFTTTGGTGNGLTFNTVSTSDAQLFVSTDNTSNSDVEIHLRSRGTQWRNAGFVNTDGNLRFFSGLTNVTDFVSETEAMRIDSSGNVGIGTTSPSSVLTAVSGSSADETVLTIGNDYSTADATGDSSGLMFQLYRSYSPSLNDAAFIKAEKEQAWDATDDRDSALVFGTRDGATEPTERMRIDSSGNLDLTNGGGDIIMANGAGIDFSATANSSGTMSNELLDDYEEGTWNPTLIGAGGSAGSQAYAIQAGRYVKVGGLVVLTGFLTLTNKGSFTGSVRISGLPFTVENNNRGYGATVFYGRNLSLPANSYGVGAFTQINTTYASVFTQDSQGTSILNDYASEVQNTTQMGAFTIAYYTTS